eukprot:scaffold40066_cov73-Phaeocystis_antarctica.AAC.1
MPRSVKINDRTAQVRSAYCKSVAAVVVSQRSECSVPSPTTTNQHAVDARRALQGGGRAGRRGRADAWGGGRPDGQGGRRGRGGRADARAQCHEDGDHRRRARHGAHRLALRQERRRRRGGRRAGHAQLTACAVITMRSRGCTVPHRGRVA